MDPAEVESVRSAIAQQGAWLGQHTAQITSASREVEDLSSRFTELSAQLDQVRREVSQPRQPLEAEPHATSPPPYDGDPNSCRAFLSQCSLVFALQPRRYATEQTRVAFCITLLTGRAREWGTAVWDARAPCCQSFDAFRREMEKLFDRSVQGDAAAARLVRLVQDRHSVTDYSIRFKTLATACGWNDSALRAQFVDGLNDEIQDEIATHDLPSSLDDIIELALKVEARMLLRQHRRTLRHRVLQNESASSTTPTSLSSLTEAEPMQLGRMRLSQKERERRLLNSLCLYCGKSGHFAKGCPLKDPARR